MKFVFSTEKEHEEFLGKGLNGFNGRFSANIIPYENKKDFGFYAYDGEQLVGGICGNTDMGNWLHVELLYVDGLYRGKDVGTGLMCKAEEFAKENGCVGIHLKTWSWQARGFYEKMGFTVFGQLEDHPPGEVNYYLKKKF